MNTLYISHNIFLSKKQRYDLVEGHAVKVIGTFTQVFADEKFKDPKDIHEYFCLYNLIPKNKIFKNIYKTRQGYDVCLLNNKTKNSFLDRIKNLIFSKNEIQEDVKKLLDVCDGGAEWMFILEQDFKKNLILFHKIQIQKIETLLESLI
jgi:hypothetical protein